MALNFKVFFRQLTRFTLVVVLVYTVIMLFLPSAYISDVFWAFIPFFYLVVLLSKYALNLLTRNKKSDFTSQFISITVIRFLVYVGVLLTYALLRPEDAIVFVITFFVIYFIYTMFEVAFLYRELSNK